MKKILFLTLVAISTLKQTVGATSQLPPNMSKVWDCLSALNPGTLIFCTENPHNDRCKVIALQLIKAVEAMETMQSGEQWDDYLIRQATFKRFCDQLVLENDFGSEERLSDNFIEPLLKVVCMGSFLRRLSMGDLKENAETEEWRIACPSCWQAADQLYIYIKANTKSK